MMCVIGHTAQLLNPRRPWGLMVNNVCFLGFFLYLLLHSKSTVAQTSDLRGEINQPSSGWLLPPPEQSDILIRLTLTL